MNNELLTPSLDNDEIQKLKSYDISQLFIVAFFGGIIPTVILGYINMKWLKINKKVIVLSIILGVLLLASKVCLVTLYYTEVIDLTQRSVRLISKIGAVVLYGFYYLLMKSKFRLYQLFYNETEPLLKPAIKWIIFGIIVEVIFLSVGRSFA